MWKDAFVRPVNRDARDGVWANVEKRRYSRRSGAGDDAPEALAGEPQVIGDGGASVYYRME